MLKGGRNNQQNLPRYFEKTEKIQQRQNLNKKTNLFFCFFFFWSSENLEIFLSTEDYM